MPRPVLPSLLACTLALLLTSPGPAQDHASFSTLDLRSELPIEQLVRQLATNRVIFVGEEHERYDHHLNQLEIIRRLHDSDPNLAIGVEYFQQPFQSQVDDYITGKISEQEFLRSTEYYSRWRFDYRLYAPIFRYAREHKIPVRALNVPGSLVSAVSKVGIAGVSETDRMYLPHSIQPADAAYKARLMEAFRQHPGFSPDAFNRFVEAQLVWDEGMAECAAAYLDRNPGRRMVILAGEGHIEFGSGIPQRLERRTHAAYATVLSSDGEYAPKMADYLLLSNEQNLPPAGTLNVELNTSNGESRISSISAGAAQAAGLKPGDVLVSIEDQPIQSTSDVKLALWDKKPGEVVHVKVRRKHFLGESELKFEVKLAGPRSPSS
jgi:uncharacterized iron-regulated protein